MVAHSERLPECEAFQCEMKNTVMEHLKESLPVRENVTKHCEQILTLNKVHEAVMEDIKEIKDTIVIIKEAILGLKIWILTAAVAGLVSLVGIALWVGGDKKQVEINTNRLDSLERIHPRGSIDDKARPNQ